MIHEQTSCRINKAFASMFHAESGHDEFRSAFERKWGTPTSLVLNTPGKLVDFKSMESHKNSRISTNILDQGVASCFRSIPQGDSNMDPTASLGAAKGDGKTETRIRLAIKKKEGLKKAPVGIYNVPTLFLLFPVSGSHHPHHRGM